MIFIGNGALLAARLRAPLAAPAGLRRSWTCGWSTRAGRGSWWRLLLGALTGDMYRSSRYLETRAPSLTVTIDGPPGYLARDGEVTDAPQLGDLLGAARRRSPSTAAPPR